MKRRGQTFSNSSMAYLLRNCAISDHLTVLYPFVALDQDMEIHKITSPLTGVLSKWIVLVKNKVNPGFVIAEGIPSGEKDPVSIECSASGVLKTYLVEEGATISAGDEIAEVEVCTHPAFFKDICVSCGEKMVKKDTKAAGNAPSPGRTGTTKMTVTGGHTVQVSIIEARRIQQSKMAALKSTKKLALVLDLDNTLLHATATSSHPPEAMAQATPLYIEENGKTSRFFVKFRPTLDEFLSNCLELFEMTVYTHGTRKYAEGVCKIMDPDGRYFGKRVVSRTDHPEMGLEKCLARLFLEDWSMAVVLDDREDVWKGEQHSHLVCLKPYVYFNNPGSAYRPGVGGGGGGEINNAPGMLSTGPISVPTVLTRASGDEVYTDEETVTLNSSTVPSASTGAIPGAVTGIVESETKSGADGIDSNGSHSPEPDAAPTPLQLQESRDAACLLRSFHILEEIHHKYYGLPCPSTGSSVPSAAGSEIAAGSETGAAENGSITSVSVGTILDDMRRQTLRGCVVCFSGVIPITSSAPELHPLWRMAIRLGATVSDALHDHVTHLLATSTETHKARQCIRRRNVFICHPDWLLNCHWHIRRESEGSFLIANPPQRPVEMFYPPDPPEKELLSEGEGGNGSAQGRGNGGSKKRNRDAILRPQFCRSNAGVYGVSCNTDSSSGECSSDEEEAMRLKVRRSGTAQFTRGDDNDGSSDGGSGSDNDDWLKDMEEEVMAAGAGDDSGDDDADEK